MRKVRHRTLLGHFRIIEIGHLGEELMVKDSRFAFYSHGHL
jgi:hypothetical protein